MAEEKQKKTKAEKLPETDSSNLAEVDTQETKETNGQESIDEFDPNESDHENQENENEFNQNNETDKTADIRPEEIDSEKKSESEDEKADDEKEPALEDSSIEEESLEEASDDDGGDDEFESMESDAEIEFGEKDKAPRPETVEAYENEDKPESIKESNNQEKTATSKEKPRQGRSFFKIALAIAIVLALLSGFVIFDNKSKRRPVKMTNSGSFNKSGISVTERQIEQSKFQLADPNGVYRAKLKEAGIIRNTLLQKNEEIDQLKQYYQKGIKKLEDDILNEINSKGIISFAQAMLHKRIELDLRSVQRRQAYIRMLDQPSQWIVQGSEELLYLRRKMTFDLQMIEVASGIDMDTHVRHINAAIQKYRPTADKLAVEIKNAELESLESIWNRIESRINQASFIQTNSKNQIIYREICAGNLDRIAELSEISIKAAKCLSNMQGSDLFLNGISELSPTIARHLFQWKGRWICLNGFRALSPRVASYLFQWEGDWISLNGLSEFPSELAKHLLQWKGKQLELMGLKYNDNQPERIGLKYLALWEKSGGKLFVPKKIREKIEAMLKNSV